MNLTPRAAAVASGDFIFDVLPVSLSVTRPSDIGALFRGFMSENRPKLQCLPLCNPHSVIPHLILIEVAGLLEATHTRAHSHLEAI